MSPVAAFTIDALLTRPLAEAFADVDPPASDADRAALADRLFTDKLGGWVHPEVRARLADHRRQGHTTVLVTSTPRWQVEPFARDLDVDEVVDRDDAAQDLKLADGFAYGSSLADSELLATAGQATVVNPDKALADEAAQRGWDVLHATQRTRKGGPLTIGRTAAAFGGMAAGLGVGAAVGLVRRSRRAGINAGGGIASDLALALAGVRVNVSGEEHLAVRPAVFVFNHASSLDMFILGKLLRHDITAVAKKELAKDPSFAAIGYLADVAYVDREGGPQAIQAVQPVVEKLRSGVSLVIAPEGTRSPSPRLGPFKKGAFHLAAQAGVPVVPFVIRNAGDLVWKSTMVVHSGTVDVVVLPPVAVTTDTVDEAAELVRAQMAEVIGA
jgi:putative phosphoserine phosphatase/1-acylglycerol-3-phosphate O-acyltransferase